MKSLAIVSAAALALSAGAAVAKPDHDQVEIRNAVARVVVIVEDRADVGVEIQNGTADLPALRVTRNADGRVRIDGGLRNRVRNCTAGQPSDQPGQNASAEVRGHGRVNLTAAPLIVIRAPRSVDIDAGSATFGAIGRGATSVELEMGGCGGWTVANVDGPLSLGIGGSGDIRAGTSRSLELSIGGSGDISAGATGDMEAAIGGSGDINVARVDGRFEAAIAGSGDILVRAGEASDFEASIAGGGDIDFRGRAANAEVSLVGGGDVHIQSVTGNVERSIMGSGSLTIGDR
jgi:hypothetical protein